MLVSRWGISVHRVCRRNIARRDVASRYRAAGRWVSAAHHSQRLSFFTQPNTAFVNSGWVRHRFTAANLRGTAPVIADYGVLYGPGKHRHAYPNLFYEDDTSRSNIRIFFDSNVVHAVDIRADKGNKIFILFHICGDCRVNFAAGGQCPVPDLPHRELHRRSWKHPALYRLRDHLRLISCGLQLAPLRHLRRKKRRRNAELYWRAGLLCSIHQYGQLWNSPVAKGSRT